jgi:tetratricopeptide (TPR) repeat protein
MTVFRGSVMHRKVILLFVFVGFLAGCQNGGGSNAKPLKLNPPSVPLAAAGKNDAAAYYYFSAAQMKLKAGEVSEAQRLLDLAIRYDPQSSAPKLELAGLYLIQKDSDAALQLIQRVLSNQPDNAEALVLAGRIYQQRKALQEAKSYFERALAANPSDPNVYLYLGRIYWNDNDLSNAERIFHKMVVQFPTYYAAHYFRGMVLAAQGKNKQAEVAFTRSLELEPSVEEPRFELIKIYKSQNRIGKAIEMYTAILANDPDNVEAAMELAVFYHQHGQSKQGLPLLADLGRRSEKDGGILSHLFENYLGPKQYKLAVWVLSGMLKGSPGNSDLHYLAGVAYDGLKLTPKALYHLRRVDPDSRFYKNAVLHRALLLRDSKKLDQSIEVVRQALKHDPKNADYYLYLGMLYEERRQYDKAVHILSQGLAVDSRNIRIHFRLGIIQDKAGNKQDAIAEMKSVLQLQPQDAEALNYLGYTYADLGIHLDEAETLIRNALKIKPDDGYIKDSLAWVYYKKGRYEEALKWLKKAEMLVPDDPVILEHLGDVHMKLNSNQKALKYYERSLKVKDKDRDQLEQKIRALNHDPLLSK